MRTTFSAALAALLALGALTTRADAGDKTSREIYEQDFDGFDDGTTDFEDGSTLESTGGNVDPFARVDGGSLLLTLDGVTNTNSRFWLPADRADFREGFELAFDFFIEAAEDRPADGFSFNYGPLSENPFYGAEEGFGSGLSVEVDTWDGGFPADEMPIEAGYNVAIDGIDVAGGHVAAYPPADGVWRGAKIVWTPAEGGMVDFSIDDEPIFSSLPTPGFAPAPGDRMAFAARTGGKYQTLRIDNVRLDVRERPTGTRCTLAKLKAARKYALGLFKCMGRYYKLRVRDIGAAKAFLTACIAAERERFRLAWDTLVAKADDGARCDDGLVFEGVSELVENDIVFEFIGSVERATAGLDDPTRALVAYTRLGGKNASKRIAAYMKDLRKGDPGKLSAALEKASLAYDRGTEKLRVKEERAGGTVDAELAESGDDVVAGGSRDLSRLVAFAALENIRDELLAYWSFDEDGAIARNRSSALGSSGDGVNSGNAAKTPGLFSNATRFDGAGDSVRVTSGAFRSRFESAPALTFSAWIRPAGPGNGAASGGIVFNKEGEIEVARFADGSIRFAVANSSNQWGWDQPHPVFAPINAWTHVVVAIRPGETIVWVNGHEASYAGPEQRGDVDADLNDFWIGDRPRGPQSFHGDIDDFGVWTRKLDAVEIRALHNAGVGTPILR